MKNLATSSSGNQFKIDADLTLLPEQGVALVYDATSTKWRFWQTKGIIRDNGLTVGIGIGASADAKLFIVGTTGSDQNSALTKTYASTTQGIWMAYDTSANIGYIGSVSEGVAHEPIKINALGGNVFLGHTSSAVNVPSLTASQIVKTDASKNLVSAATIAESEVTSLVTDLAAKAPLASPTFTGLPIVPNIQETQSALTYSATPVVDMSGDAVKMITMTGDLTSMTTSNRAAGRKVTVILDPNSSTRALTAFNASWRNFSGAALPTTLASGKYFVFTLYCTDGNETGVLIAGQTQI